MPDVARQRVSSDARVPSPRGEAERGYSTTEAGIDSRSGQTSSYFPKPGKFRDAMSLFMGRLDRSMKSVSVRRVVGALGAMVALFTALSIPAGYAVICYWKDAGALSVKADLSAAQAARVILARGADWRSDTVELANAIEARSLKSDPIRHRIIDNRGAVVLDIGEALARPTYARGAPIVVEGVQVGRVEVTASLRPLLTQVGFIALGSLTLAIAAYFVFAILPLRVLDRSFADLGSAGDKLRRQNLLLDAALANMFQGLAMFDTDERLVIANHRFAEMYGLTTDQVWPGTTLRTILEHRIAAGLHSGETADSLLQVMRQHLSRHKAGHLAERLSDGRAILVSIRPRPEGGWVTTHQDVTERENLNAELALQNELLRQREDQLQIQNEQFNAALRNMSQGLCMFDAEQRVVVANARYAHLYDLAAEQVRPGATLREIVEARIAKGIYAGEREDYAKEYLETLKGAPTKIHHLNDGRSISVSRQPMHGGGWVTTHEDVTERQNLLAQLESRKEQLDVALNNMSQGLAMFDAEQRLVVCNGLYAQMYGLTLDQVKPGTTLQQIADALVAAGRYSDKSALEVVSWMRRCALERVVPRHISELDDGRAIAVSARKMPAGGMVTTHQDITEQRRAEAKIVHMALHDTLTELPNRVLLDERLGQALTRVRRGEVVAVHMAPDRLEIEVTELVLLGDNETTLNVLTKLRDLGVRISMDDFGTGYSSLSQLRNFHFDTIKIDRSFVKGVAADAGSLNIVRAVTAMANGLGMSTTAEGVETREQLDIVRSEGCTEVQSYFFSPPVPAVEVDRLLRTKYGSKNDKGKADAA
jgi:PAS domain-containing protein